MARRIIFSGLLAATAAFSREEPPLPEWDAEEREALMESGWIPGALLLTDDPVPEASIPVPEPFEADEPTREELAEDEVPSTIIPEAYINDYFAERPQEFLVDPQGLLSSADFNNRLAFLDYHSGDSSIDLFIYVFTGDQEIPSEVRCEETIERFFSEGKPAGIVFYYLGAPQRSAFFLSSLLTDVISAPEQRRALQSSVTQAFNHTDAGEQLAAFTVQMSIRLYWMERMIQGLGVPGDGAAGDLAAGVSVSPLPEPAAAAPGWLDEFLAAWGIPTGVGISALLLALGFGFWLERRARYRFPDFEVEPRLDGPHAAGVGAVISFASAATPPASQRDQVPDYLRRA